MISWFNKQILKWGFNAVIPWWAGYAAAAALGALVVWRVYATGVASGRAECAAAALAEQQRQAVIAAEEHARAAREAVAILQREMKRNAEINTLDNEAAAAAGADDGCLDADGVRRVNRIR